MKLELNWMRVVLILGLVAGAVTAVIFAPEDYRPALVGLLTAVAGLVRSPTGG